METIRRYLHGKSVGYLQMQNFKTWLNSVTKITRRQESQLSKPIWESYQLTTLKILWRQLPIFRELSATGLVQMEYISVSRILGSFHMTSRRDLCQGVKGKGRLMYCRCQGVKGKGRLMYFTWLIRCVDSHFVSLLFQLTCFSSIFIPHLCQINKLR